MALQRYTAQALILNPYIIQNSQLRIVKMKSSQGIVLVFFVLIMSLIIRVGIKKKIIAKELPNTPSTFTMGGLFTGLSLILIKFMTNKT
jgi:hypothetical protein